MTADDNIYLCKLFLTQMIVYLTGDFYWRLYCDCDWLWNLPTFPSDTARWRRALQTQNADSVQSHQWSRRREGEMDEAEQGVCCSNQTSRWWVYAADTSRFCQILQLSVGLISLYSMPSFKLSRYYFITSSLILAHIQNHLFADEIQQQFFHVLL